MERDFKIIFKKLDEEIEKNEYNLKLDLDETITISSEINELKKIYETVEDEQEYDIITNS